MLLGEGATRPRGGLFLVTTSAALLPEAFRRKMELVAAGVRADMDYEGRSLKSQFRRADRSGAKVVLVLGEEEGRRGAVAIGHGEGIQEEIPARGDATPRGVPGGLTLDTFLPNTRGPSTAAGSGGGYRQGGRPVRLGPPAAGPRGLVFVDLRTGGLAQS